MTSALVDFKGEFKTFKKMLITPGWNYTVHVPPATGNFKLTVEVSDGCGVRVGVGLRI